jgi:hypothetical protein
MKRFGGPGISSFYSYFYIFKGIKKQACKNRPKCLNEITEDGEEAPEVEQEVKTQTKSRKTFVRKFSHLILMF